MEKQTKKYHILVIILLTVIYIISACSVVIYRAGQWEKIIKYNFNTILSMDKDSTCLEDYIAIKKALPSVSAKFNIGSKIITNLDNYAIVPAELANDEDGNFRSMRFILYYDYAPELKDTLDLLHSGQIYDMQISGYIEKISKNTDKCYYIVYHKTINTLSNYKEYQVSVQLDVPQEYQCNYSENISDTLGITTISAASVTSFTSTGGRYEKASKQVIDKYKDDWQNILLYDNNLSFFEWFKMSIRNYVKDDFDEKILFVLVDYPVVHALNDSDIRIIIGILSLIYLILLIVCNKMYKRELVALEYTKRNNNLMFRAAAHELKTPLGIIKNSADNLAYADSKESIERMSSDITAASDRMDELIMDMLNQTRLDAGAVTLDKEDMDLSELCEGCIKRVLPLVTQKNIVLEKNIMPECIVMADVKALSRIIMNFMINAIRHTENGKAIRVRTIKDSGRITLQVENDGKRYNVKKRTDMWEWFYSDGIDQTGIYGGTGLGLAISKTLLELHGASYGCDNTENGIMFWFTLAEYREK